MTADFDKLFDHMGDVLDGPCWYCEIREPRPSGLCEECAAYLRDPDHTPVPVRSFRHHPPAWPVDAHVREFRVSAPPLPREVNIDPEALAQLVDNLNEAFIRIGQQLAAGMTKFSERLGDQLSKFQELEEANGE